MSCNSVSAFIIEGWFGLISIFIEIRLLEALKFMILSIPPNWVTACWIPSFFMNFKNSKIWMKFDLPEAFAPIKKLTSLKSKTW